MQRAINLVALHTNSEAAQMELKLENRGPATYAFCLSPGGLNFTNDSTIISSVCQGLTTPSEKALALFRCVGSYTSRCNQQNKFQEEPTTLLTAYGCGFCSDINHSLMELLGDAGIPARLYNLTGHVVTEAYFDSAWHMLDADRNFFVYDSAGAIASVDYVSNHPEILASYAEQIIPFSPWESWQELSSMYQSRNNNYVVDTSQHEEALQAVKYVLNPGDAVEFEVAPISPLLNYAKQIAFEDLDVSSGTGRIIHRLSPASPDLSEAGNALLYKVPDHAVITALRVTRQQPFSDCENLFIYYSTDSLHWLFKGELDNAGAVYWKLPNQQTPGAGYVKFTTPDNKKPGTLSGAELHCQFIFSSKLFLNEAKCFNITGNPGAATVTGQFTEAGYELE